MYKIQDVIADLINEKPVKSIARIKKIFKNTVKKYKNIFNRIQEEKPEITGSVFDITDEIKKIRKEERYSKNYEWLEKNKSLVEKLSNGCDNYVRPVEVLHEHGFMGSYSSLRRYLNKNKTRLEAPIVKIETNPGEIAQVDFDHTGKIYDENSNEYVKAYIGKGRIRSEICKK